MGLVHIPFIMHVCRLGVEEGLHISDLRYIFRVACSSAYILWCTRV